MRTTLPVTLCATIISLLNNQQANAEPLPVRDLNPLLAGFELPPPLLSDTNSIHHESIDVSYATSNISLLQQAGIESVIADAESRNWQLTSTHVINSRWSVQLALSYQSISGGSLDRSIENFHRVFNFPDGNRKHQPRDRLLIDYSAGYNQFHLDNKQSGIGDTVIRTGWHFDSHQTHTATVWFSLKAPTGNANHLIGSGAVDAAITLAAEQSLADGLRTFEQGSLSWLGKGKRLTDIQKRYVWSGVAGVEWALTRAIEVVTQLQTHSQVYDSGIRMLDQATQFIIGPQYHASQWQASLSIAEDVAVDTAPDVQFQFNLAHQF